MPSKTNNSLKSIKAQKNPTKGSAILKAAGNIFAQKGFHEATISDIAKKAEVSEAQTMITSAIRRNCSFLFRPKPSTNVREKILKA